MGSSRVNLGLHFGIGGILRATPPVDDERIERVGCEFFGSCSPSFYVFRMGHADVNNLNVWLPQASEGFLRSGHSGFCRALDERFEIFRDDSEHTRPSLIATSALKAFATSEAMATPPRFI